MDVSIPCQFFYPLYSFFKFFLILLMTVLGEDEQTGKKGNQTLYSVILKGESSQTARVNLVQGYLWKTLLFVRETKKPFQPRLKYRNNLS